MPRRTNAFQALVAALESSLSADGWKITESAMLPDKMTGETREIDILLEGTVNRHSIRIAIECRDHDRSQDVEWIDSLVGRFKNIGVDKIVAVSSSGFTAGALQRAKAEEIGALSFTDALSTNWREIGHRYVFNVMKDSIKVKNLTVNLQEKDAKFIYDKPLHLLPLTKNGQIVGSVERTVFEILKPKSAELRKEINDRYRPPIPIREKKVEDFGIRIPMSDYSVIDLDGNDHRISDIVVIYEVTFDIVSSEADIFNYNDRPVIHANVEVNSKNLSATIIRETPDANPKMVSFVVEDPPTKKGWTPKKKMK